MSSNKIRKIAVVLVDRANYGRLKPVMTAIKNHPQLELSVICGGTMVLERFARPINIVKGDGFDVCSEVYIELEGSTPGTMAKSLGFGVIEFTSELSRVSPDIVLVIGDRYEGLAAALAASYLNLCLAHIQGGEVSGSIDESARHCISKLSQFHFPSTARSAEFLIRMGETPETVFHVGCPSGDIALSLNQELPIDVFSDGIGVDVDCYEPYLLVVFHPVTTHLMDARSSVEELLESLDQLGHKVVWLWPNIDAGSDGVSAAIRRFREKKQPRWLRLVKNFSPDNYLRVLSSARCAIGNSSSFVRDSSFLGTPVVLVGDRQDGRECAENVLRVCCERRMITEGVRAQINHGRYPVSRLYGDGNASSRIADHLATVVPYIQKSLAYISNL